jgi:hypothetical protein
MAAMDELVEHIVGTVGIDRGVAEKAVGIILDFLIKEGPEGAVNELLVALPGAREAAAAAGAGGEETGGAGGLFGAMGGLMGAANRLMAAGLTMSQVQAVTREVVAFARNRLGEDAVGQIVGSIPGLGQIV